MGGWTEIEKRLDKMAGSWWIGSRDKAARDPSTRPVTLDWMVERGERDYFILFAILVNPSTWSETVHKLEKNKDPEIANEARNQARIRRLERK